MSLCVETLRNRLINATNNNSNMQAQLLLSKHNLWHTFEQVFKFLLSLQFFSLSLSHTLHYSNFSRAVMTYSQLIVMYDEFYNRMKKMYETCKKIALRAHGENWQRKVDLARERINKCRNKTSQGYFIHPSVSNVRWCNEMFIGTSDQITGLGKEHFLEILR